MSIPIPSAYRQLTGRACDREFDCPVNGGPAMRHHCEDCLRHQANPSAPGAYR